MSRQLPQIATATVCPGLPGFYARCEQTYWTTVSVLFTNDDNNDNDNDNDNDPFDLRAALAALVFARFWTWRWQR